MNPTSFVSNSFNKYNLGQQVALLAAALCLCVSLALVTLAAISARHMQMEQQEQYGNALARLVSLRVSIAMEQGDLLSASASLQRFIDHSAAQEITLTDIDGNILGQAGDSAGINLRSYSSSVHIESDIAGQVSITVNSDQAQAAQQRFLLSLLGLSVLLSMAAYGGGLQLGQRLGTRLARLARALSLEEDGGERVANEVEQLNRQVDALPMDLLRTRGDPGARDENYRTTAVLYLHLSSLVDYLDTLDERALHNYTDRLHQIIFAAAGFYAGELQVIRQFGLAVYFSGDNNAGSAAFRAASCGWLIQAVAEQVQQQTARNLDIAMAIAQSELGAGDGGDIYPGLYMQHTLDELQQVCSQKPPNILLSPAAAEDIDVNGRLQHSPMEVGNYAVVEGFASPYDDLLDRQLRLIMKRLADPGRLSVR